MDNWIQMRMVIKGLQKIQKLGIYVYTPLNPSASEIRLLELLPGKQGEDVHARLHTQDLSKSSSRSFEALSYTWGSTKNPVLIYLSPSHVLPVTQNLAGALHHLRYRDRARILWVDAICVNQQDLEERSEQVPRMADIYTIASRVIVWLGPSKNSSTAAMKTLEKIGSMIEADWRTSYMTPSALAKAAGPNEAHWADRDANLPFISGELNSVCHLLARSWFERLWIRQEIILATDAVIVCGLDQISWINFQNAIFCFANKEGMTTALLDDFDTFWARVRMVFRLCDKTTGSQLSLPSQIERTKDSLCSDPRDRVYALLSLLPDTAKQIGFKVDYRKSVGDVYRDAVLEYIDSFMGSWLSLEVWTTCEMQGVESSSPAAQQQWCFVPSQVENIVSLENVSSLTSWKAKLYLGLSLNNTKASCNSMNIMVPGIKSIVISLPDGFAIQTRESI